MKVMNKDIVEIIRHYGYDKQERKLMEEIFELTEAITEYEMVKDNKALYSESYLDKCYHHVAEELADAMLLLKQFKAYYNVSDDELENIMQGKIARTFKRIDNEQAGC